jgi:hypothetical protein
MCQSYRVTCVCGREKAEIFFGRMILNESSVARVYCPSCSREVEKDSANRVWDNGWMLELNLDVVRNCAPVMEIPSEEVTATRVFDEGFATWVGITPDDFKKREQERSGIQDLAKTDLRAYLQAMKEWGMTREKRFIQEGWRKMRTQDGL